MRQVFSTVAQESRDSLSIQLINLQCLSRFLIIKETAYTCAVVVLYYTCAVVVLYCTCAVVVLYCTCAVVVLYCTCAVVVLTPVTYTLSKVVSVSVNKS